MKFIIFKIEKINFFLRIINVFIILINISITFSQKISTVSLYYYFENCNGNLKDDISLITLCDLEESKDNNTFIEQSLNNIINVGAKNIILEITPVNSSPTIGFAFCFKFNDKLFCLGANDIIIRISGFSKQDIIIDKTLPLTKENDYPVFFYKIRVDKIFGKLKINFNPFEKPKIFCNNLYYSTLFNASLSISLFSGIDISQTLLETKDIYCIINNIECTPNCDKLISLKTRLQNGSGSDVNLEINSLPIKFTINNNLIFSLNNRGIITVKYKFSISNSIEMTDSFCTMTIEFFNECPELCRCGTGGDYYKCLKCNEDSYLLSERNNCFTEDKIPNGYYLDKIENKIKKCSDGCLLCYFEESNKRKCKMCNKEFGYYPVEDDEDKCMNSQNVEWYYFNKTNEIYKRCHWKCKKCLGYGDDIFTNCSECNGLHFHPTIDNHCVNDYELNDNNYYLDKSSNRFKLCHFSCKTCTGQESNQCSSCDGINFFKIENNETQCLTLEEIPKNYYLSKTDDNFHYRKCFKSCKKCSQEGNEKNQNCDECNTDLNYYPKENDFSNCVQINTISCYYKCSKCKEVGDDINNNCDECDNENGFYFEDGSNKKCINISEKKENYYLDETKKKFMKCDQSCKKCSKGGTLENNNCDICDIQNNYYPIEDNPGKCIKIEEKKQNYYFDENEKYIKKCSPNCEICSKGFDNNIKEMYCEKCKINTFFQNITSTNCLPLPKEGWFIKNYNERETLFSCYYSCRKCKSSGTEEENNCIECADGFYPDEEKEGNCIEIIANCGIGCAKCFNSSEDEEYGILSADKMCKVCSTQSGYYPLQKYSEEQYYVNCYPKDKTPENYIFSEEDKEFKICYVSCSSCYKVGNDAEHACTKCAPNFVSNDDKSSNCYGECKYYHYYNIYGQYKCSLIQQCPTEAPYLIKDKQKCIANCYEDNEYKILYLDECLRKCPEGLEEKEFKYNGQKTVECVKEGEVIYPDCFLDLVQSEIDYKNLTIELLVDNARNYIHNTSVSNNYVFVYKSQPGLETTYLSYIYKQEKCAKEKVQGFVYVGLDECIEKLRLSENIISKIVVQVNVVYKLGASAPSVTHTLYHPDTGEILNETICQNNQNSITSSSLFDKEGVNDEKVRYLKSLGINPFNINDPFFKDVCFYFELNGKDVPLEDRIERYYQNVTLCESGCIYISMDIETFEVKCSCETKNSTTLVDDLISGVLSTEIFGSIADSNLNVLKCIKNIINGDIFWTNKGGLMILIYIIIQIIASIFVKSQMDKVRIHIFKDILKEKTNPPRKNNNNKNKEKENKDKLIGKKKGKTAESEINKINERRKKKEIINNKTTKNNNQLSSKDVSDKIIDKKNLFLEELKTKKNCNKKNKNGEILTIKDQDSIDKFAMYDSELDKNLSNKNGQKGLNTNIFINFNNINSNTPIKYINDSNEKRENNNNVIKITKNKKDINNLETINSNDNEPKNKYEQNLCLSDERKDNSNIIAIYKKKHPKDIKIKNEKDLEILSNLQVNLEQSKNIIETPDNCQEKRVNLIKEGKLKYETSKAKINKQFNSKEIEINFLVPNQIKVPQEKEKLKTEKMRQKILKEIKTKEIEKRKEENYFVAPDIIKYEEDELDQLDFDEAVLYDGRSFCRHFINELFERQQIINTFFECNPLKPFSIKLIVLLFSITSYFAVNCFLYDADYVSKLLNKDGSSSALEFITSSYDRVIYTSFIGGIIGIVIGILFNSDKKIKSALVRFKDKKSFLKGEIARNYRLSKKIYLAFILLNFIFMLFIWIYIYCFCSVYRKSQIDWFESGSFIILIMQAIQVLTSLGISLLRYIGIRKQNYIIFQAFVWISTNF